MNAKLDHDTVIKTYDANMFFSLYLNTVSINSMWVGMSLIHWILMAIAIIDWHKLNT